MSSFWNQPAQQESGGSSRLFMSGEQQQRMRFKIQKTFSIN